MGTANYSVGTAVQVAGGPVLGSAVISSGSQATSGSATNIAGLALSVGQLIQIHADVAMRVRFGGTPATTSTGIYIPAGTQREILCQQPGAVSLIDV